MPSWGRRRRVRAVHTAVAASARLHVSAPLFRVFHTSAAVLLNGLGASPRAVLLRGRWPRKRNKVKIRCDIMPQFILRPWRGGERLLTTPLVVNLLMRFTQRTFSFNVECFENLSAAVYARGWFILSANWRKYSSYLFDSY